MKKTSEVSNAWDGRKKWDEGLLLNRVIEKERDYAREREREREESQVINEKYTILSFSVCLKTGVRVQVG